MAESEASSDNPGVIAFPPLIWLVSVVISALVHFFVIRLPIMSYSACLVCGIVLVILAPTLAGSALVAMKAAGTNVSPSKPALTIVRSGPFRFTRNPMYLALCLLQVAPVAAPAISKKWTQTSERLDSLRKFTMPSDAS